MQARFDEDYEARVSSTEIFHMSGMLCSKASTSTVMLCEDVGDVSFSFL
jgi:hypothetical protein